MKFHIYNPEPLTNCNNPACNRFHSKTQDPSHIFDCYKRTERQPIDFQCSERINKLAEPHPRHVNTKKYVENAEVDASLPEQSISKKSVLSTRLEHLAAPIFRRIYTTRQKFDSREVSDSVKQNLNSHMQRSMYNLYSRLENVNFTDLKRPPLRKAIKSSSADAENRRITIQRLCQPHKLPQPAAPIEISVTKRPINMDVIKRLSVPRKIKSPEQINYTINSRPLQSKEYYERLSQPRKILEEINNRDLEPKLTSMQRTKEIAVPLPRLQKRKFMKGDNEMKFPVSRAALEYQATAKIKKLSVPKRVPEDPNAPSGKSKRKK